jgi:hypothetical protein
MLFYRATHMREMSITMQDLIAELDSQAPTFMDNFGAAARSVPIDKDRAAMEKLAMDWRGPIMPNYQEFFNALSLEAGSLNFNDVKKAAVESIETMGNIFKWGSLGAMLVFGAVAAFLLLGKVRK